MVVDVLSSSDIWLKFGAGSFSPRQFPAESQFTTYSQELQDEGNWDSTSRVTDVLSTILISSLLPNFDEQKISLVSQTWCLQPSCKLAFSSDIFELP